MNPFYSLVRIVPGPAESDVITVGLLAHSGSRLYLRLSPYKIRLARHFFKAETSAWVDSALRQLQVKVKDSNMQMDKQDNSFQFQHPLPLPALFVNKNFVFEFAEVDYMSKYYNGILQFTSPKPLAVAWEENIASILYKTFVNSGEEEEMPTESPSESIQLFQSRIENKLIKRVANKVNTNLQVKEFVLPSLHYQFELDCIGINGALVGAYAIDFSQSATTTDKKFGHYVDVISRLIHKYQRQESDNAFYLIADEPDNSANTEKTRQWRSWKEAPQVRVINSQEVALVAERIETTNAHRLVEFADTLEE